MSSVSGGLCTWAPGFYLQIDAHAKRKVKLLTNLPHSGNTHCSEDIHFINTISIHLKARIVNIHCYSENEQTDRRSVQGKFCRVKGGSSGETFLPSSGVRDAGTSPSIDSVRDDQTRCNSSSFPHRSATLQSVDVFRPSRVRDATVTTRIAVTPAAPDRRPTS